MNSTKLVKNISIITGVLLLVAGSASIAEWRISSLYSGLMLSLSFLLMVVWVSTEQKNIQPWANMAIAFGSIYVVFASFNYAFTLAFMGRTIPIPELMDITQTDSAFLVIEMLAYFFMGLCTLSLIPLFGFSSLEKSIKVLFALNGFLGIGGLFGYMIDLPMTIMYWGLLLWNLMMPLACFLLALFYRKKLL